MRGDVDAVVAQERSDSADDAGPIRVFQHEHDAVRARFHRAAVDVHDPRRCAEKCSGDGNCFAFRGGGEFEEISVIAHRAQARFRYFQAKTFREGGRVHFVDFAAAGVFARIPSGRSE